MFTITLINDETIRRWNNYKNRANFTSDEDFINYLLELENNVQSNGRASSLTTKHTTSGDAHKLKPIDIRIWDQSKQKLTSVSDEAVCEGDPVDTLQLKRLDRLQTCNKIDKDIIDQADFKGKKSIANKNIGCNYCDILFKSNRLLKSHIKAMHSKKADEIDKSHDIQMQSALKEFCCGICAKKFTHSSSLSRHKFTHSDDCDFACDFCGKRFKTSSYLKNHLRIHGVGKHYLCDTCGKHFNHPALLTIHRREHTGERPYVCDLCGKYFKKNYNLQYHLAAHEGNTSKFRARNRTCNICGKSFETNTILDAHMRIHTGEKPFKCGQCGMCFRSSSNLHGHSRVHSEIRRYLCKLCGKSFKHPSVYKTHMKGVHSIMNKNKGM